MPERTCKTCGKTMTEGYCFAGGEAYYCSEPCLNHDFTEEEWNDLCAADENDCYWTQWED